MDEFYAIAARSEASQDYFELAQMLAVIDQLQPKRILEIGVHTGNGLLAFREAFPDAELFGIEVDTRFLEFVDFHLIQGDARKPEIIANVAQYAPFDFIFIDGDHTYGGVKSDWDNYQSMVRPGGAVGFHDSSRTGQAWEGRVEVRKLMDELRPHYKWAEFSNGPENPGTTIIWP